MKWPGRCESTFLRAKPQATYHDAVIQSSGSQREPFQRSILPKAMYHQGRLRIDMDSNWVHFCLTTALEADVAIPSPRQEAKPNSNSIYSDHRDPTLLDFLSPVTEQSVTVAWDENAQSGRRGRDPAVLCITLRKSPSSSSSACHKQVTATQCRSQLVLLRETLLHSRSRKHLGSLAGTVRTHCSVAHRKRNFGTSSRRAFPMWFGSPSTDEVWRIAWV